MELSPAGGIPSPPRNRGPRTAPPLWQNIVTRKKKHELHDRAHYARDTTGPRAWAGLRADPHPPPRPALPWGPRCPDLPLVLATSGPHPATPPSWRELYFAGSPWSIVLIHYYTGGLLWPHLSAPASVLTSLITLFFSFLLQFIYICFISLFFFYI